MTAAPAHPARPASGEQGAEGPRFKKDASGHRPQHLGRDSGAGRGLRKQLLSRSPSEDTLLSLPPLTVCSKRARRNPDILTCEHPALGIF